MIVLTISINEGQEPVIIHNIEIGNKSGLIALSRALHGLTGNINELIVNETIEPQEEPAQQKKSAKRE